jgi:hypothetical protein
LNLKHTGPQQLEHQHFCDCAQQQSRSSTKEVIDKIIDMVTIDMVFNAPSQNFMMSSLLPSCIDLLFDA